ncbi:hypothetical protein MLD38_011713 [Melastoma candidum]|uniref:Uncharacterized protein n=1 Tax=Melastoma candidum TaxID=119954 RepID=A0ACB9R417_9MYRT|nr:hypothetical protein MLD38_011713 [Melastoma candidum]
MPESDGSSRPLFGGAVSTTFPLSFQDVSEVRQVPDHQEVFADPWRDQSLIFELLELKQDVEDHGSAVWFLQDIAAVQDAGQCTLLEQSGVVEAPWLVYQSTPAVISTVIGQMSISKGRQGRDAQNVGRVYLADLRLKEVNTDMLITAYEPILINPLSESATTVVSGLAASATEAGVMPMAEVFKLAVSSLKVHDWSLFGNA